MKENVIIFFIIIFLYLAFTSHNPCRKNILLEIAEKEEEEDSTLRNDSINNKNKNDIKNQSEIYFTQNKKLIFNNYKNNKNDESKNNEIINIKNDLKENEKNKKEVNIFNNYILYAPKNDIQNNIKVNAINYINLYNKDNVSKNLKTSFINILNQKNDTPYNIINRYDRLSTKQEPLKEIIINDKKNENIQKIALPNLNLDKNRNKRSLSSNKKYDKYYTEDIPSKNIPYNSLKNSYSHPKKPLDNKKENNNNNNIDNDIKINLLSSVSKSSNILIPIVSKQSKSKNYNLTVENNERNIRSKKYKYRISRLEENNKCNNNLNELIKNKGNNSYNRNTLILDSNNFNNNLFLNIDRTFMSKLHQIKIEKGMNGNKIYERFGRNLFNKEHNYSKTAENNKINNILPPINKVNDNNHI